LATTGRKSKTKMAAMAASVVLLSSGAVLISALSATATVTPTITSYATFDASVSGTANNTITFRTSAYQPANMVHDGTYAWIAGIGNDATYSPRVPTSSKLIRMDSSGSAVVLEIGVPPGCNTSTRCTGLSLVTGLTADSTYVWFGTRWGYIGKVAKSGFSPTSTITWVNTGSMAGFTVTLGPGANGSIWYSDGGTSSSAPSMRPMPGLRLAV